LVALDALDSLDKYKNVFNIDYYRTHKNFYYSRLFKGTLEKNDMYAGVYDLLAKRVSYLAKVSGLFIFIKEAVNKLGRSVAKKVLPQKMIEYIRK
jgi:hypothetical protein